MGFIEEQAAMVDRGFFGGMWGVVHGISFHVQICIRGVFLLLPDADLCIVFFFCQMYDIDRKNNYIIPDSPGENNVDVSRKFSRNFYGG